MTSGSTGGQDPGAGSGGTSGPATVGRAQTCGESTIALPTLRTKKLAKMNTMPAMIAQMPTSHRMPGCRRPG